MNDCVQYLGDPCEEVHKWLDALAISDGFLNVNHRRYRHHQEALEEVYKLFGAIGVAAATLHILADLGSVPTREQVEGAFPNTPKWVSLKELN